ncbi:MAG TPA: phosphate ABC transporter substrate-binding protein PstS, partial [Oculatellaceae cyanobacterium]
MVFSKGLSRVATASVVTAAITLSYGLTTIAQALTLNGAGATFPKPLYDRYIAEFTKKNPGIKLNYEAIGSGGGIKQFIAGTVDFAGSDAAMTNQEIAQVKKGVLFVPTAGGAVSVVYNVPGVNNLKLSRATLPAIFMGQITRWDDAKIKADNPGVKLPARPIRLVVRSDSSGTSFIFTNHLSAANAQFKSQIGANKSPSWKGSPLSGKGNAGVGALVKQTQGAIGYVESTYDNQLSLSTAMVQNRSGQYVAPSLAQTNKALAGVPFQKDMRVDFSNRAVADPAQGYPIAGLTWLMVNKSYAPDKAAAMKKFVQFVLNQGQSING